MSDLKHDVTSSIADAESEIVAERRHIFSRLLDWLRGRPRFLAAIIVALMALAIALGVARV
jgi:hypothetical protein